MTRGFIKTITTLNVSKKYFGDDTVFVLLYMQDGTTIVRRKLVTYLHRNE